MDVQMSPLRIDRSVKDKHGRGYSHYTTHTTNPTDDDDDDDDDTHTKTHERTTTGLPCRN